MEEEQKATDSVKKQSTIQDDSADIAGGPSPNPISLDQKIGIQKECLSVYLEVCAYFKPLAILDILLTKIDKENAVAKPK